MEKRLRSSLRSSAADFLSAAASLISSKPGKSSIKTFLFSLPASSDLLPSLPPALHLAVSRSLDSFKASLRPPSPSAAARSSLSPPAKRSRSSATPDPNPLLETLEESVNHLHAYSYIAHLCVTHPKKPFQPSDLLPSVQALHDSLVLYESEPALLSQVAALCEEWWKERLPGRETLISQSIPFLLSKSMTQSKKTDVRRVYALREAFLLFDYLDESIEDLRLLLVRCVITPVYLKTEEGRKFIAFMMGLNGQLMKESLALIKSQIPFERKSVLEGYADILFRAWKGSEGEAKEEIEDGFLQGLIEGAIHASSKSLAASARRILGGFIEQRATEGVEKLLFRLTEPVLFRSLQVANSNVRQNALHVLLDVFPLEDPEVTKEIKDTLLEKQFFLLEKLILDDCPNVRMVAVEGSCRILHLFWEVIPSTTITKILAKVVDVMSHDMSNEVRLSTVKGITYLLDNPQSHEILKVLLPRLGCMLFDRALSVRLAVADLLLAIRDIRTFQFNKVVGLDAILSSLANDHPSVAQKITRLLLPSYFPSKVNLNEACGRCISLIKRSPSAGARFCEFALSEGSSLKNLMELLRVTLRFVLSPKGLNADQVDGLLIASAGICRSLFGESSCKMTLCGLFSNEKLKCLLTAATSQRAKTSVIVIASMLSVDKLAGFEDQCMDLIMCNVGLSEDIERQAVVQAAHRLMFSCGWFDKLFGALTELLETFASSVQDKSSVELSQQSKKKNIKARMKSSGRSDHVHGKGSTLCMSNSEKDFAIAAAAAWQIKDLLSAADTRSSVLKSPTLKVAFSALKIISQISIEQCVHWETLDMSPLLAYTGLATHMFLENATAANIGHDKTDSVTEPTVLDHSLNDLLNCADKLFCKPATGKVDKHEKTVLHQRKSNRKEAGVETSNLSKGSELNANLCEVKRVQNVVKMVTSILKFTVDATTMKLVTHSQVRCLRFASAYVRYVVFSVAIYQKREPSSTDESLKEMMIYLKSSFTYAAKLLHLVLSSCGGSSLPLAAVFGLSNDLLDLIVSVESYIGSNYASLILSVAKPWLSVLILGLGAHQLIKPTVNIDRLKENDCQCPAWLTHLGKAELHEVIENEGSDQIHQSEVPAFNKLMQLVVVLLKKGSSRILDAVGCVFTNAVEVALERSEHGVALGLVHLTCVKLLGREHATIQKDFELMSQSLQNISLSIEGNLRDLSLSETARHRLQNAKSLVASVCFG